MAVGRAVIDIDLCPDTDRLLCVLPALSFARDHGFQFLSFLVAYAGGWAVAIGTVVVPLGAARVRYYWRRDLADGAPKHPSLGPMDRRVTRAADDSFCGVHDRLGGIVSADASGLWRWKLV